MFPLLIGKKHTNLFKYLGDRQMTKIFVSGTEMFSYAKMTETHAHDRPLKLTCSTFKCLPNEAQKD